MVNLPLGFTYLLRLNAFFDADTFVQQKTKKSIDVQVIEYLYIAFSISGDCLFRNVGCRRRCAKRGSARFDLVEFERSGRYRAGIEGCRYDIEDQPCRDGLFATDESCGLNGVAPRRHIERPRFEQCQHARPSRDGHFRCARQRHHRQQLRHIVVGDAFYCRWQSHWRRCEFAIFSIVVHAIGFYVIFRRTKTQYHESGHRHAQHFHRRHRERGGGARNPFCRIRQSDERNGEDQQNKT